MQRVPQARPMKGPMKGRQPGHDTTPAFTRERARRLPTPAPLRWTSSSSRPAPFVTAPSRENQQPVAASASRRRLLAATSGGLEGLGLATEAPPPHAPVVAPRHGPPDRLLERRVAFGAVAAKARASDRDIPRSRTSSTSALKSGNT